MTIILYKMNGCGFCNKAEQELKNEIANGEVVVKPHSEAPSGITGFPHFENVENKKSHTGFAKKEKLMVILGYKENFSHRNLHHNKNPFIGVY